MNPVYTVSALTAELKDTLEQRYGRVQVEGEISNSTIARSGHAYFKLKDADAVLDCVCWRGTLTRLGQQPTEGRQIVATGSLTIYPPRGQYQLVVRHFQPAGVGRLQQQFEELKNKLKAEGLFDPARKRPLPRLPRRIGVVTSPTGAAVRDFLRVLHRRFPHVHVTLAPAQVQGKAAAGQLVQGLQWLNRLPELDVIVLTRGGGSLEDLWPFNEETVARAIAASALPVVSAVGHEVDFTIADFVADHRSATPTAAAEELIASREELQEAIAARRHRLQRCVLHELQVLTARVEKLKLQLEHRSPRTRITIQRQTLDALRDRLERALRNNVHNARQQLGQSRETLQHSARYVLAQQRHQLEKLQPSRLQQALQRLLTARRNRLQLLTTRIRSLDPTATLQRGYTIATTPDGRVVHSLADVDENDTIHLGLPDGRLDTRVTGKHPRS